ncbi:hypothetical protein [Streptococcus dysgalactiae]|nr:hypothetical protein [Streptococcus dysgalactiae]EFY02756.1 hypothetical protein SDD27957_05555 [Streptococcus dysgalactiae subsp. dysgalactiae ATCC 27957]
MLDIKVLTLGVFFDGNVVNGAMRHKQHIKKPSVVTDSFYLIIDQQKS